jgi:hypothetical protein
MKNDDRLAFLDDLDIDYAEQLRRVWWLKSEFTAPVWIIDAGYSRPKTLDWRVKLDDNSDLTDTKNTNLLNSFRYWLAASTEGRYKKIGDGMVSEQTDQQRLNNTLYAMDYLLLNAGHFKLARFGLLGINDSHLKTMLDQYAGTQGVNESIYDFRARATEYLMNLKNSVDPEILHRFLVKYPSMSHPSSEILEYGKKPLISDQDLPLVRAALYRHNYYTGSEANGYHINIRRLTSEIYTNTFKKTFYKLRLDFLSFFPEEQPYLRELPAVCVTGKNSEGITLPAYMMFRRSIISLTTLHSIGVEAPSLKDIQEIENYKPELAPLQRYTSVPCGIIFNGFKEAVELHFRHGRKIIDGFLRVARHCIIHKMDMKRLSTKEFQKIIGPELVALGVRKLGLSCENFNPDEFVLYQRRKPSKDLYFSQLRANHGLLELLSIYIGSVQFVVGALMARRNSEMRGLPTSCLDETLKWLIIDLAKTTKGLFGVRDTQARPIDRLGTKMIRELQRMQRYLKKIGFLKHYGSIFSTPSLAVKIELKPSSFVLFNRNLDLFCDYIQNGTDSKGNRYYFRQHQLRRFFALLFFHYFDKGTINALRWFFGHSDPQHIWNYITATIDGASIRGAKAQHLAQQIIGGRAERYEQLSTLLKAHFNTENFTIQDEERVDNYLQDLQDAGKITIEPVFFENHDGKQMNIVVKVHHI